MNETVGKLKEKNDGTYSIQLDSPSTVTDFTLTTKITDQHASNYTLTVEAALDKDNAKATDVHHTRQNIEGTVTYDNLPEDENPPATIIHLIDTATSETVGTMELPPGESSFTFEDIRKYNDDNSEIIYEMKTEPLGNYSTTLEGTTVVHEYLEAAVEGTVSNTSGTAFSIEVVNDKTGAVVRTIALEPAAKSYAVEDLPLNDADGNTIPYSIHPIAQEGAEITVKDNNIEVNDIKIEESTEEVASEETSVEQPEKSSEETSSEETTVESSEESPEEAPIEKEEIKTPVTVPVQPEEETTEVSEEIEKTTEEETEEKSEEPEVVTEEAKLSESESSQSDEKTDIEVSKEEPTEESTEETKSEEPISEEAPKEEALSELNQDPQFMPRMFTASGIMSTEVEKPLFPRCENSQAAPFQGIANNQANIGNMTWQEHELYRNRTPQPIKYDEGYLQKCAQPNGTKHSYSIDVTTQGTTTTTSKPLDVVLVLDNSGSMRKQYADGTTRWQRTRAGVVDFVTKMTEGNDNVRISIVNYAEDIISSSNLSNDTASIISTIPRNYQNEGTFTQKGLREGKKILEGSPDENKQAMILLTAGAPTYSYRGESVGVISGVQIINEFDERYIMGNGSDYELERESWLDWRDWLNLDWREKIYRIFDKYITNHGQPTISEAIKIQNEKPDWQIYTVGIDLEDGSRNDGASTKELGDMLESIASDPAYAFSSANPINGLPGALNDIQEKMSFDSFIKSEITDSIGDMYDLDFGSDNKLTSTDYTLTASSPEIKSSAQINYNSKSRTFTVTGVNLGEGDWLNLNYNVKLRTDDPNFKTDTWYAMNKRTTVIPNRSSNRVLDYPIPEAKALPKKYDFIFTKTDENDEPLANAKFQLKSNDGSVSATATSASDGKVDFKEVTVGKYILTETSAPHGYQPDGIKYSVTIEKDGTYTINGQTYTAGSFHIKNMPKLSKLKVINYVSGNDSDVLPGATFELRDLEGNTIGTATTDENGELTFSDLRYGDYLLVMTKAPEGHKLDAQPTKVTLGDEETDEVVKVSNDQQVLPQTGGIGTVPFFIIGLLLILLSLISKYRLNIK
ncbi:VWA domain-containing protein [Salinicoccus cyprini]|uniref:VWA domain-containing protein n=1 Tax=Salinicoccus cyprini TaxID=2493691 RepID=A0A558AS14_9STAP|nr:vWA domain-containing protein [Salinicoccus cyprini]TVT27052.1 VWA domain-containing protein [Salinicoccus cyprini]